MMQKSVEREKNTKGGCYARKNTQLQNTPSAVSFFFSFFSGAGKGRNKKQKTKKINKKKTPNPPEVIPGGEGVGGGMI